MDLEVERGLRYLYGLQSHGIKPGLSRTCALLQALGNPHRGLRVLHVGGTNGKGSTAAMLASMLAGQGYRTGLYTSPHLADFTERIQVNGRVIPAGKVGSLTAEIKRVAESHLTDAPTFFEATTVMAFAYFAECAVECAVVEVGLGGRFDATNVLTPLVSIITTIGMDHQEYLGSTLEAIAGEKAGIVKDTVPVVLGRIEGEPLSVIRRVAEGRQAPCVVLDQDFSASPEADARFSYRGLRDRYEGLVCPLPGRHQLDNAACALAALELAGPRGLSVGADAMRQGLRIVRWPGRLELVGQRPTIWLDGAHNPHAAEALAAYLREVRAPGETVARGRLVVVLGMMRDKDRRGVLAALLAVPGVSHLILTRAAHPRAADPEDLARESAKWGVPTTIRQTVGEAFALARTLADPDDSICVTGSLFVVGEVKALLEGTAVTGLRG